MNETSLVVTDQEWETYQKSQSLMVPNRAPSPCGIKFHGDSGKYSLSYFDQGSKETKFQDIEPWHGVIVAVRWFAKWKFKENSPFDVRTREFSIFRGEPINLLKINKGNRDEVPTEKVYSDYGDFKAKLGMTDEITGQTKYPFDLFCSAYVYAPDLKNPVEGKIVRYRFGGTTRSNFFDYMKTGVSGVVTSFGVSEKQLMPTKGPNGEDRFYYTGTFKGSPVPPEMRRGVMDATKELNNWFASWNQQKEVQTVNEPVAELPTKTFDKDSEEFVPPPYPKEESVDVSDIPF